MEIDDKTPSIINDKSPFGQTFNKSILEEETVSREYAKTGSPIKHDQDQPEKPAPDRVDFDYSQFDTLEDPVNEEEDDEDDNSEISQTDYNSELDSAETALNKKVQAKIAKSQSKNIVGMYLMLLRACWKWVGKVDEQKLSVMHSKGQVDINTIISNHPLIYHIKTMNNEVDEWEIDEDQEEAIVEALEIYMISKNIQTSPGMNLAMAMGVPLVEMIGRAISHKRSMKTLINSVIEMNKSTSKQKLKIDQQQSEENQRLSSEIEEMSRRNSELMNANLSKKSEIKADQSETGRPVKRNRPSRTIVAKTDAPALKVDEEPIPKKKANAKSSSK